MQDKKSFRDSWLWKTVSDLSTLITLVPAFGITWLVNYLKKMPAFAANPVEYLAATGFVFVGTWTAGIGTVRLTKWAVPLIKKWRNPPMLSVISHGGQQVRLTLTHSGYPTEWQIRRRIVKVLYEASNPDPAQRLCAIHRDGRSDTSVMMHDGEMADIVLVSPYVSEWHSRPWVLEVNYEHSPHGSQFDGERGAIIEIEIKAVPPLKDGPTRLCYIVMRKNPHGDITVKDAPCEKF